MMFAPVDLWRGYDIVTLKGGAGMIWKILLVLFGIYFVCWLIGAIDRVLAELLFPKKPPDSFWFKR
jgi:hypothetical protein